MHIESEGLFTQRRQQPLSICGIGDLQQTSVLGIPPLLPASRFRLAGVEQNELLFKRNAPATVADVETSAQSGDGVLRANLLIAEPNGNEARRYKLTRWDRSVIQLTCAENG